MSDPAAVCLLDDLGLLSFRGPDSRKFLQGQLSNDTGELRAGALLRAGLHTPQGRTLAVLALVPGPAPDDEVLAVLPRELIAAVAATLKRYVLRAKVTISDASAAHRIYGLTADAPGAYPYDGQRKLLIARADANAPAGTPLARTRWRALDITAGLPQLYLATSGQFVAQMLNLDHVGAVAFDKGCYTGQEVIARAHYRGRVKRRMQRFVSEQPLHLVAGDSAVLGDGRSVRVVEAVQREDGRCEFLGVTALPGAAAETEPAAAAARARIEASALPLPYPLD